MFERWMQALLRAPDGDAGGGGETMDAGSSGADTAASPPDLTVLQAEARPDWLPETFYDAQGKLVRVQDMAKSYASLHSKLGERVEKVRTEVLAEIRKGAPEKPEGYEWKPDTTKIPQGAEVLAPAADDPLVVAARGVLHRLGGKPEDFGELMDAALASQIAALPDLAAEKAKLGDGADGRIQHVEAWLTRTLGEKAKPLIGAVGQAEVFLALEELSRQFDAGAGGASGTGAGGGAPRLTPEEAVKLMNDPRYREPSPEGEEMRKKVYAFLQAGGKIPR